MQFPEFSSLPEAEQKKWGYTVQQSEGNNPGLYIHLSSEAAKLYHGARLYIKDNNNNLLSEVNMGLYPATDGGLGINLNLFERLNGKAELIIYTYEMPDTVPFKGGFGGFTFNLSKGFKNKTEQGAAANP
jgi:hypothetical protein